MIPSDRSNCIDRHSQILGRLAHLAVEGDQLQAIQLAAEAIKEEKMARISNFAPAGSSRRYWGRPPGFHSAPANAAARRRCPIGIP